MFSAQIAMIGNKSTGPEGPPTKEPSRTAAGA
ncbi:DUF6053 domain-containing protein [Lysobacter gummosus]